LLPPNWREEIILEGVPLGLTLNELKQVISERESVKIADPYNEVDTDKLKVMVDLFTRDHPLLSNSKSRTSTLKEWGFGNKDVAANLFVSFRYFTYKTAVAKSSGNRFDMCPSWNPYGSVQTNQGMSAFLSCLYVIADTLGKEEKTASQFLGHLRRLLGSPPAVLVLYYLLKKKSISDAERGVLSSSLFHLFKEIVPAPKAVKDTNLFEFSRTCFGLVFSNSKETDVETEIYKAIELTDPLTFVRIQGTAKKHQTSTFQRYSFYF